MAMNNNYSAEGFYNPNFSDPLQDFPEDDNQYSNETTMYDDLTTNLSTDNVSQPRGAYPRIRATSTTAPQGRIRPNTIKHPKSNSQSSIPQTNFSDPIMNSNNNFIDTNDSTISTNPHSHVRSSSASSVSGMGGRKSSSIRNPSSSSSSSSSSFDPYSSANSDLFFKIGMGMASAVAMGQSPHIPTDSIMQTYQQYTSSFLSYNYYRYYFKVDNTYVLHKISKIVFPFLKMKPEDWHRKLLHSSSSSPYVDETQENDGNQVITSLSPEQAAKLRQARNPNRWANNSPFEPPTNDINAPDMYIPLMAIITYIVLMGYAVGSQQNSKFTPQVLVATASSAFGMLIFEVLIMKSGFWFIGNVAVPPFWLDLVCYAGYKLIFVVMNLGIFSLFHSLMVYYLVSISTGCLAGLFMIQTLRPYFRISNGRMNSDPTYYHSHESSSESTKRIFLGFVGLAQVIFIQLMGRYIS